MNEVKTIMAHAESAIGKILNARVNLYLRIKPEEENDVEADEVFDAIELITSITKQMIKSPQRHRPISDARMIFCFIMKNHTKLSLYAIGRMLGDRDHSTVIHSVNKCRELFLDPLFFKKITLIYSHLNLQIPNEKA